MKTVSERHQLVVCGGGLAGFCAAVSAARHGVRTCIIQDRPVFGGNSSSEIRVMPLGSACYHAYARETGIISELLVEERARNHQEVFGNGSANSVWDMTLYDMAVSTPNLTFHLNTTVQAVQMANPQKIAAVVARSANAEVELTIAGDLFVDCTGDGVVAVMAGCEWRMGSEGRDEFGEPHAPSQPTDDVMGSSLLFKAVDVGRPTPFEPPEWAVRYDDPSFFYEQGRVPETVRGGYWWIELGMPWNTIHDNEIIRHELTRHLLGVWDWIKNKDPRLREQAVNYALDWIGQVPGKRESRRIMGRYLMTECDLAEKTEFPDEIAYGGWFIDLHTPGGLLAASSEPLSASGRDWTAEYGVSSHVGPYGIPLRILIARDVDNLMLAGRDVSVTRAALGTMRLQATTALMGQAVGAAAAVAVERDIPIYEVPEKASSEVQQMLLRDGCFLLNVRNEDPADLARLATVTASSEASCWGAGPESRGNYGGLTIVPDAPALARRSDTDRLEHRRGQWIATGADRIDVLWVCLSNPTGAEQAVEAELLEVDHIWDYRVRPGAPLARTTLRVPPGRTQWIEWRLGLPVQPGRYVRLDLLANPNVQWHTAGALVPGHTSACQISSEKMRQYKDGWTMSFRISPAQLCYPAGNVLSGVTRPYQWTNLWRSDPVQPLDQWLELRWPTPQTIGQVELTFPGQLFASYRRYPALYRDPQCARDYTVAIEEEGEWRPVIQVTDNYHRHRRHALDQPMTTDRLRIVIHATNGDPSAAIYEVRCYGPG